MEKNSGTITYTNDASGDSQSDLYKEERRDVAAEENLQPPLYTHPPLQEVAGEI